MIKLALLGLRAKAEELEGREANPVNLTLQCNTNRKPEKASERP